MEISNKLILPILGVVALIILGYFLTQIFGSFGQLNYQTRAHCIYDNERFLSLVEKGSATTADEAWNNSGRTTNTLVVDGDACDAGVGGLKDATTYYTPNGATYTTTAVIAAGAVVPNVKGFQPLDIMTANGGILSLIIQALPLIASLGILGAGYMWYKGGFGPSQVSS